MSRNDPISRLYGLEPRAALAQLIADRGEDFVGLSRLLGRNPAYIQQFIKRGTPRKLHEEDRRTLARYFKVDESVLGGTESICDPALVELKVFDITASAGPGALVGRERKLQTMGFDPKWLRDLSGGAIDGLSVIRVRGDSMVPTLTDGDDVIVNRSDSSSRLRDGIYVLRLDDQLIVKRIARIASGGSVVIHSDNPAYPEWRADSKSEIDIVGRVLWFGRRVV